MTHSYRAHYYHLIWSTKNRAPLIADEHKAAIYSYMGGIVRNHEAHLICIGGTSDHVHLLISMKLPDKYSVVIKEVKRSSSLWMNNNFNEHFSWQEGYGSFTVSYSSLEKVIHYIENQE
ncbi:MAG: IS200/IS605 family transposase, partial [Candidatus Berkiella sp.]